MTEISCQIAPGMEPLRDVVGALAAEGVPPGVSMVYDGPRNKVYSLALTEPVDGVSEINIKAFKVPHPINRVVYGNFRPAKARRAYDNAMRLLELGVDTPRPLACIEQRRGMLYGRSYYVSEQLSPMWQTLRQAHLWPDFPEVVQALARFMVTLHSKGVWMKDFTPGNVLVSGRGTGGGTLRFCLVDINRMEFGLDRSDERLLTNFQWIFDTPAATRSLVDRYARLLGHEPGSPSYSRLMRGAFRAYYAKRRSMRRKHRLKAALGLRRK